MYLSLFDRITYTRVQIVRRFCKYSQIRIKEMINLQ